MMTPVDSSEILRARDRLLNDDVVAIPTETVYGLAASIESEKALRKIFSLKERPFFDPLIVHVASFKQAMTVCKEWPPLADFLARTFWPGPLTLVLPKADHVSSIITSGLESVAIRYPAHPLAQEMIRLVGAPLAAPSANKFGRTSPSQALHVRNEFKNDELMVLDGGSCSIGVESTVIEFPRQSQEDLSGKNFAEVRILRPGGITAEMLRQALTRWSGPTEVTHSLPSDPNNKASPGHLQHHYMPKIPLVIVDQQEPENLTQKTRERIARAKDAFEVPKNFKAIELELDSDAAHAARELYSSMRECAESGADLIFVRTTPSRTQDLWLAIWDRLNRAASLDLTEPPLSASDESR